MDVYVLSGGYLPSLRQVKKISFQFRVRLSQSDILAIVSWSMRKKSGGLRFKALKKYSVQDNKILSRGCSLENRNLTWTLIMLIMIYLPYLKQCHEMWMNLLTTQCVFKVPSIQLKYKSSIIFVMKTTLWKEYLSHVGCVVWLPRMTK